MDQNKKKSRISSRFHNKETFAIFRISQKQEVQGRKIFSKWASWYGSDWETDFSNEGIRSFSEIPKIIYEHLFVRDGASDQAYA